MTEMAGNKMPRNLKKAIVKGSTLSTALTITLVVLNMNADMNTIRTPKIGNGSESQLPRNPKGLWDELPEAKRLIRERQQVKDHKHDPNSFFTSDYVRPGPSESFPSSQKRETSQAFTSSPEDIYGSNYAKNPLTKILLHQELHNGKTDQKTKRGSLWKQIEDSHDDQQKLLEVAEKSEPPARPSGGEDDQTESDDRRRLLVKIAQMVAKKRASDVTDDEIALPPDDVEEKLEPKVNLDLAQFQRHRADFLQNSKPVFKMSDPQEELDLRTHKLNGLTMRVLERAKLRQKPQYQSSGLAVTSGHFENRFHDDKIPTLDTSKFLKRTGEAGRRMDDTENPKASIGTDGNRLVSQIKALTVFEKIQEMQMEIKELNKEIQEENRRIENAENELSVIDNSKEEDQLDKQEKMNMIETVREIKLKKEDAKMKAIETQIKLKRLQDKDRVGRDDPDLEAALQMVAARRKLIQEALVQQRRRTLERQKLAALALESKKSLDAERLRLAGEIQQEERNRILRQRAEKERELTAALESSSKLLEKARNRVAHKKLAEASNQRVITKIQSLALKKRQEAVRQRNILAKAQLAKLTSTLPIRSQLQKLRINEASKPVSQSPLTRIRPSSPLLRLTPKELTEVLSFLDLQKNADILAKTNEKVVAKAKANNAAEALILDAAKQALGEDSLSLTDSEVDDLLGVNEIIPVDPVLDLGLGGGIDILGLDYPDPLDDYNVDLEDILIDYEYEFDTPILPTGPVGIPGPIGVPGPGISLTPTNLHPPPHGYYSKPKPLAKPHKSHSYQYFQQVNNHHHPNPLNHYHEPEPYHVKKPEPYHPLPPPEPYHPPPKPKPYYPPPKPEPYYDPPPKEHHHKDEHYHKHEVHDHYKDPYKDYEVHHLHEDYHPPPKKEHYHQHHEHPPHKEKHYPEPEYYSPPHKEEYHHHKPEYYKPEPHHQPEYEYHEPEPYHEPEYEYHEPKEIYHPPPPKKHFPRPTHHHDDHGYDDDHEYDEYYEEDYIPHGYKTHDPYIDKDYHRKPKHHHQEYDEPYYEPSSPSFSVGPYHAPPKQTGAEFLSSVSPLLDVAAAGLGNQGQISGLLRHSLLRDIQDKVDTELHLGPGGQHTRVTIGRLPPDPPRLTPPFRSRSSDNSRSRRQIKSSTREKSRKKEIIIQHKSGPSVTFSDLMSDFLSKDPLPIHEKQRKSKNV
ncbi:hypothetical protein TCAL_17312 [Tigriopus californicus]|uniref:Uncharacterized protein n=1 Tax=Tigriopus californicus TaxID=6832 RepID=A0A553NYB1_TIGCA|nr:hypothetical protein TCAL_17312 [Tigriopus californicus]